MVWPTTYSPAREHRNIASPAMSWAVPTRPLGLDWPTVSQSTPSVAPPKPTPVLSIQVGKGPGAMALNTMRSLVRCVAIKRVRWCTAALDAPYENTSNAELLMPSIEPILITRAGLAPCPAARSRGSSFCVKKNTPLTLVSITLSQPTSGNWSSGAPQEAPALFTKISSLASRWASWAARLSTPARVDRSAGKAMHSPP